MPTGLRRYYGAQHLHFITCSCYRRLPLLGTAPRRSLFLKVLEQARRKYGFVVTGYVVMPEHFHWTAWKQREKLRYMHMNPVKRKLVSDPAQWKWSSFRWHALREHGLVQVNADEGFRVKTPTS